ncbi:DUF5060 domain-containing protein [Candidatus Poribacteria bacterium]|nr:DUF5060 domain-containing protein [Candidatus Poribacteria bacterium]
MISIPPALPVWLTVMALLTASETVPKWEVFEVTLHATSSPENPFTDITLTATVTKPDGEKVTIDGFYDGDGKGGQSGDIWKLRFCHFFRYADGGYVYLMGNFLDDTAPPKERYSHTLLSEEITEDNRQHMIDRARKLYKANKINIYIANKGDYGGISTTPWLGTAERNDKTRFDLARWRMYERIIRQLKEEGIIAELWFFADDSGFGKLSRADRERLIRYGMARLSAYPNTMFVLCLEWQEGWSKEQVASDITFAQKHNPWHRLWSVHGVTGNFAFPNQPWIDFMATQPGNDAEPKTVPPTWISYCRRTISFVNTSRARSLICIRPI